MHEKEKGIIKYIYDYARKLKELDEDGAAGAAGAVGAAATGGGSIRRRRKRRNRQSGGVNTWQDKFINVLKGKMPDKEVKKAEAPKPEQSSTDEEEDDFVYYKEKDGVSDLSKRINLLEEEIGIIKKMKKDSLGLTIYKDLKSRLNKKKEKGKDEEKPTESSVSSSAKKSSLAASAAPSSSVASAAANLETLNTLTDLAKTLQVKIENSSSEGTEISKKQEADLASTISLLQHSTTKLISGGMNGGAGNSDDQLKMRYLDNNKYKGIKTWKKIKELKSDLKTQPENIDENNKIARLSQDIDAYNLSEKTKDDDKYIIQQLNNFENDPKNPLDELAITFDDRLVFIIATFFIRYITIIIVQWCIDINIIKTFYEGFIYYAIIYIIIFWFVVLFINIDNGYDVKYMNFNGIINSIRTLFYYFYMGTNGISRLLVHTSLIIILIIIPIILNIKRKADYVDDEQTETEKILDNEERKQLSKSLSLFTMFIWLFTSIIATKF
jgi:hypothetical protein